MKTSSALKGLAVGAMLGAAALLQDHAQAITRVHFVEYSDRVEMNVTGTFRTSDLTPSLTNQMETAPAGTNPNVGNIRSVTTTGNTVFNAYDSETGGSPSWGDGTFNSFTFQEATSSSGFKLFMSGIGRLLLPEDYSSGSEIESSATFQSKSFADLGIALGVSTFDYANGEQFIVSRKIASVPGPLPLFGAAAAFGYSRKLRKRI